MKYLILGLLFLMPFLGSQAQDRHLPDSLDKTDTLDELVVSGSSRATRIRQSPIAVVPVSARAIDAAMEPNIIDALVKNVPGLTAVKTGPNISKPFIRGLGYNRVLTLYDGIRQEGQQWGDEHGIEADAYNIEKAEVIKGPASLLYGSDALAGVISLFPFTPKDRTGRIHGRLLQEYQSNNALLGTGIRLYAGSPHWYWVVTGSIRQAKNYTNRVDDRVYNTGFSEKNIAATVDHSFRKGHITLSGTLYDNMQGIPDGSRDSASRRFTYQVAEGSDDDIRSRPVVPDDILDSRTLSPLHQHISHYRLYTTIHYKIGAGDMEARTGFQQNIRKEYNHPTAPAQAGLYVRLNTVHYGLKYSLPVSRRLELSSGADGMIQSNASRDATDFPIPDYRLSDLGAYLYAKWQHERWIVSGGIRYDTRTLHFDDFYVSTDPRSGFGRHSRLPDTSGAGLPFPALHKQFRGVSASGGATWAINQAVSLKFNIANGYRSPNITEIASNGLDPGAHIIYLGNRSFQPEFSFQQDVGILLRYPRFRASASLFNNSIMNYIYLSQLVDDQGLPVTDPQGNRTFQYMQGSAGLYGFEADADWQPAFWKGGSWSNALAMVYGFNTRREFRGKGNEGEYLPLIPPFQWTSTLAQEYQTGSPVLPALHAEAAVEWHAAQDRYLALYHTETHTPDYALLHLSAGADIAYGKGFTLQCRLSVNNVLDQAYVSSLSRLKYFEYYTRSPDGRSGIYGMGRNYSLKLIAAF